MFILPGIEPRLLGAPAPTVVSTATELVFLTQVENFCASFAFITVTVVFTAINMVQYLNNLFMLSYQEQ
jgi:hypothetical protein